MLQNRGRQRPEPKRIRYVVANSTAIDLRPYATRVATGPRGVQRSSITIDTNVNRARGKEEGTSASAYNGRREQHGGYP
jgi:hypothetical protein